MSQQNLFAGLILLHSVITALTVEWVEITQHQQPAATPRPIKILKQSNANIFHNSDIERNLTTPSPEWLAYQKERFGNRNGYKAQQLTISAGEHLKNTAQVVVPAKLAQKNQIFHATTRFEVKEPNAPELSVVQVQPAAQSNVETTSRKDSGESYVSEAVVVDTDAEAPIDYDYVEEPQTESNENTQSNVNLQAPSVQGFLDFLKSLKKTWIKHAGFNIEQKINVLKRLRDTLMLAIEQHFNALWQPVERKRRNKRGVLEESSINFPPEAAILSINFLTFAVFLIKLVLQVVHILKSKHYSLANFYNPDTSVRN